MNLQTCEELLGLAKSRLDDLEGKQPRCLKSINLVEEFKLNSDGQLDDCNKFRLLLELMRLPNHYLTTLLWKSRFDLDLCIEKLERQVMTATNIALCLNDPELVWDTASYCRNWLELRIRTLRSTKQKSSSCIEQSITASVRLPMYRILNDSKDLGCLGLSNRTMNRDIDFDKQTALLAQMTSNPVFEELCNFARRMGSRFAPTLPKMWKISQMDTDQERMIRFYAKIEYRLDIAFWFYLKSQSHIYLPNFLYWLKVAIEKCEIQDQKPPKQFTKQQIFSHLMPLQKLMQTVSSPQ